MNFTTFIKKFVSNKKYLIIVAAIILAVFLVRHGSGLAESPTSEPSLSSANSTPFYVDLGKKAYSYTIQQIVTLFTGKDSESKISSSAKSRPSNDSRSFYMGFSSWPYGFSEEAYSYTIQQIDSRGDLILYHLDSGVPWPEALSGSGYHPSLVAELDDLAQSVPDGHKVYVSTTALSNDRKTLAPYWGENSGSELPDEWKNKSLDDPNVINAYINWSKYLVNKLNPDYFAYGIEVNGGFSDREDPTFVQYKTFLQSVYPALKLEFPGLPIFLTFQNISFESTHGELIEITRELLDYSDVIALSIYPYGKLVENFEVIEQKPSDIPSNWLSEFADLSSGKPFAIAETGFTAENVDIETLLSIHIKGRESWQNEYVGMLLEELNDLNAEFVAWFVIRDYDEGWEIMESLGLDPFAKYWKDTGLFNGEGKARRSLKTWDKWLNLPRI